MVGICPPEYFPRLEYMALVQHVDEFILADTFPYRRESRHRRSELRNAQGGHWIEIPLFGHPEGAPIHEVKIETGGRWREKHWRSFLYDYRTTMYFEYLQAEMESFFDTIWEVLGACTCRSVELLAQLYGLRTSVHRASELPGTPASIVEVAAEVDASVVCLPERPAEAFGGEGVDVRPFVYEAPKYRQNFEGFEPGMTAADLLFNYGPEAQRLLAQGVVVPATR